MSHREFESAALVVIEIHFLTPGKSVSIAILAYRKQVTCNAKKSSPVGNKHWGGDETLKQKTFVNDWCHEQRDHRALAY